MAKEDPVEGKPTRYTITGAGCKVIIEGYKVIDMTGPLKECPKILMHWLPFESSTVSLKVAYAIKDADDQRIRLMEHIKPEIKYSSDEEEIAIARKHLKENPSIYTYIKPEFVKHKWFDANHGPQNIRNAILPFAAMINGQKVSATVAINILMALINQSPPPKAKVENMSL